MREEERRAVRERYGYRCGYCGVRETDVGAELTVDHFQPRSHGGTDLPDNLVYCCHACNEFKGDFWQTDGIRRVLHPVRDNLAEHLAEEADGRLRSLTEEGAFHIRRLRLNRAELVAHRREWHLLEASRAEQQTLLDRLASLERRISTLQNRIQTLANPPEENL